MVNYSEQKASTFPSLQTATSHGTTSHYKAVSHPNASFPFLCSIITLTGKARSETLKSGYCVSVCFLQPFEEKGEFSAPSCYGNIKSDNGGSSLIFEHPLDDVNVVDLRWIHDFVLKSLEVLYQVEKWETLVSIAIQFNIVSQYVRPTKATRSTRLL